MKERRGGVTLAASAAGTALRRTVDCRGPRGHGRRGLRLVRPGLVWWLAPALAAAAGFGSAEPFREGEVVCFVGDSITHTGSYPTFISLFYSTRFPDRHITYFNAGISGDRAAGVVGDEAFRMKMDILGRRPTVATVMLGMNDIARGNYGAAKTEPKFEAARTKALADYEKAMTTLIGRLQDSGARVILITPSPYDDTAVSPATTARFMSSGRDNAVGADAALAHCATWLSRWAHDHQTGLVDFHASMNAIKVREQSRDPHFTLISADRIHPSVPGHFVMAYTFLQAQGLAGAVATIAVDVPTGASATARNCTVTHLRKGGGRVEFDVLEKSLPFPVPEDAQPALAWVPFTAEFNRDELTMTGLPAGHYQLKIDQVEMGEFSEAELQRGIDLAANPKAPQVVQAAEAGRLAKAQMEAVLKQRDAASNYYTMSKAGVNPADPAAVRAYVDKKAADFTTAGKAPDVRFQRLQEAVADPGTFEREEARLSEALREACRPRPHHFSLSPVSAQP